MGVELTGLAKLVPRGGVAKQGAVKVCLETDELILRGEVRAKIARSAVRTATAKGEKVTVTFDGGTLILFLGDAAERSAAKVVEPPKSRLQKMGIGAGTEVTILSVAELAFAADVRAAGARISRRIRSSETLIVLGVEREADLARISTAAKSLAPDGALWVIHPKGVPGVKDTDVFGAGKRVGLVAVKVARFSATHTAEKLMIPRVGRVTGPS